MPEARVAACLFCDDIRNEVGNKISLMGIYGGDLILALPLQPVMIPKLGAFVSLITDLNDTPERMTIIVYMPPKQTELVKIEIPAMPHASHFEGATKTHYRAMIQFPPVTIVEEEGFIEIMIETERETIRAGRLYVRFQPTVADASAATSSAPEQPFEQLQPEPGASFSQPEPSRPGSRVRRRRS